LLNSYNDIYLYLVSFGTVSVFTKSDYTFCLATTMECLSHLFFYYLIVHSTI